MHCEKKISKDMYWVGGSDRRLNLFENVFPIPKGISYNSYLITDEKTVLLDTVDKAIGGLFFENIEHVLDGRQLDYVIVNHMEPDHCATLSELVEKYPAMTIVGNAKTMTMIKQFFDFELDSRTLVIKEGDLLNSGNHEFKFIMAPMVHWPETMVTYDTKDCVLYSADAFGTFGALNGNLYADEVNFKEEWLFSARSYYANIVGKYGVQVQSLLNKAAGLELKMICPLHGPVWRDNIDWYIEKYAQWSTYTPEEQAVMIVYGSIYGNTANAADILASKLADKGIKNIAVYDVSVTHPSDIVAESFRCSHIVFASATYNNGIFCNMETALLDIKAHNLQKRTIAVIENGTWGPVAGKQITEIISGLKDMTVIEPAVTIKSAVKKEQLEGLEQLAQAISVSLKK